MFVQILNLIKTLAIVLMRQTDQTGKVQLALAGNNWK